MIPGAAARPESGRSCEGQTAAPLPATRAPPAQSFQVTRPPSLDVVPVRHARQGITLALPVHVMRFPRLLLVEDDLASVFALRQFFATSGYEVDCAAGPTEGLRLLERHSYDAVITDLHLRPGRQSEGMRIAAYARLRNPRACVAMLTASGSAEIEAEARRSGVNLYETKPVDLPSLTDSISRVLGVGTTTGGANSEGVLPDLGEGGG